MSDPDQQPPVPRYGEYAPGFVPPAQPAAQPAAPPYQQPSFGYPQPGYPGYAAGPTPVRTGDVVASVILLVVGAIGVLLALVNALTIRMQMETMYLQYDIDATYESGPNEGIAAAVIILSHVILYIGTLAGTIALIRKRRVSFWLPLSAGVLASIIFFAVFVALVLGDPLLFAAAMEQGGRP